MLSLPLVLELRLEVRFCPLTQAKLVHLFFVNISRTRAVAYVCYGNRNTFRAVKFNGGRKMFFHYFRQRRMGSYKIGALPSSCPLVMART